MTTRGVGGPGWQGPVRTCRGCRQRHIKKDLIRLHIDNGVVEPDDTVAAAGRGVYCCNNKSCLERIITDRKKLARAFLVEACTIGGKLLDRSKE